MGRYYHVRANGRNLDTGNRERVTFDVQATSGAEAIRKATITAPLFWPDPLRCDVLSVLIIFLRAEGWRSPEEEA